MFDLIEEHLEEMEALCRAHGVQRLELFGSAASGDFDPVRSDLDFFIEFLDTRWEGSSKQYFGLLHGLEDLFGRKVDLVERKVVTSRYFLEIAGAHVQKVYEPSPAKAS